MLLISSERLVVESEADWAQRLANGQQGEADCRASIESQRAHRLNGNLERIATYRANAAVEERQQRKENDCIIATR